MEYCAKVEYLYQFALYYNSHFYEDARWLASPTVYKPWNDLHYIMHETVVKEDELYLSDAIDYLSRCTKKNKRYNIDLLYSINSPTVINTVYDFFESVMNELAKSSTRTTPFECDRLLISL